MPLKLEQLSLFTSKWECLWKEIQSCEGFSKVLQNLHPAVNPKSTIYCLVPNSFQMKLWEEEVLAVRSRAQWVSIKSDSSMMVTCPKQSFDTYSIRVVKSSITSSKSSITSNKTMKTILTKFHQHQLSEA